MRAYTPNATRQWGDVIFQYLRSGSARRLDIHAYIVAQGYGGSLTALAEVLRLMEDLGYIEITALKPQWHLSNAAKRSGAERFDFDNPIGSHWQNLKISQMGDAEAS
jgi:hypothetical protein